MDMGQPASFKSLEVLTLEFGSWNCIVYCLYPGPALANWRPCSNFPSNPPFCFCPSSPFPSRPLHCPFLHPHKPQMSPLKSARDSGERYKLPQRVRGGAPSTLVFSLLYCMLTIHIWLQHWYLCLRHNLNIKVIQIGNLIYREYSGPKLRPSKKIGALFGRTPRTCLRQALPRTFIVQDRSRMNRPITVARIECGAVTTVCQRWLLFVKLTDSLW